MVHGYPPPHHVHNLLVGAICQGQVAVQLHPQGQILNLGPTHPSPISKAQLACMQQFSITKLQHHISAKCPKLICQQVRRFI